LGTIKKLAGQTFWYGLSSILGRFLNYLLTPLLTTIFFTDEYGVISLLFGYAAFLNIIFTYGMETSYFRFSSIQAEPKVYNTASSSLWVTTILFSIFLVFFREPLAAFIDIPAHPEYISWIIIIVALDTLAVMPFAKLRFEGRPRKYAFIKILNILINIGLVIFFLVYCKNAYTKDPGSFFGRLYDPSIGLGYVILANLAASAITLLLLAKELLAFRFRLNPSFWKQMLRYSWPLIIVGFGGMVNERIDLFMIQNLVAENGETAQSQVGIYSANYKLAVLIVLFIQAFRLGAEPFFFQQSTGENPQRIYARVMKFFVIACCFCFLAVVLYLDVWKYFMGTRHPEYYSGLHIVPILMVAKIFLGIYYNLSIWYKLKEKNLTGAWITIGGAVITIAFNWFFIPLIGYIACAIATVLCYGFMMTVSYLLGQKHYPVPYAWKKILSYIAVSILLFGLHQGFLLLGLNPWVNRGFAFLLILAFALLAFNVERKEFRNLKIA
jgi:O-antigen/teichoic acid export membrane protein